METLPIKGSFKYTSHLYGPIFGLKENCLHLYLIVSIITSSGYPFFINVVLIQSCSLTRLDVEQIINTRWTKFFNRYEINLTSMMAKWSPACIWSIGCWFPVNGSQYAQISSLDDERIYVDDTFVIFLSRSESRQFFPHSQSTPPGFDYHGKLPFFDVNNSLNSRHKINQDALTYP